MRYILVTRNGHTIHFYTEGCASLYHRLYGGTLTQESILEESLEELLVA